MAEPVVDVRAQRKIAVVSKLPRHLPIQLIPARHVMNQHNRKESNWNAVTRLVLATKLVLSYGRSGTDQEVCHQQLTDLARLISRTVVRSPSSMGESIPNLSW